MKAVPYTHKEHVLSEQNERKSTGAPLQLRFLKPEAKGGASRVVLVVGDDQTELGTIEKGKYDSGELGVVECFVFQRALTLSWLPGVIRRQQARDLKQAIAEAAARQLMQGGEGAE